jgi:hypothetical protein
MIDNLPAHKAAGVRESGRAAPRFAISQIFARPKPIEMPFSKLKANLRKALDIGYNRKHDGTNKGYNKRYTPPVMTRDVFTSFPREIILNYLATAGKKICPDLPNILDEMVFVFSAWTQKRAP